MRNAPRLSAPVLEGMQYLPPQMQDPIMPPGWLHPREVRRRRSQWATCKDRRRMYDEISAGLHACAHCGARSVFARGDAYLVIDHIIPISRGGTNNDINLQVLCEPCNGSKGAWLP